ncbi:MAG: hypothetical protein OEY58_12740 [Gammaproteobacteria bacterium]|nr:hypothetical protein [Gammaproteobacteria bacterium]
MRPEFRLAYSAKEILRCHISTMTSPYGGLYGFLVVWGKPKLPGGIRKKTLFRPTVLLFPGFKLHPRYASE